MSEESGRKAKSDIGQFAIVPKWLLLSGVSGNAIKCFGILCALFVDRDTGEAWPSRKKMSELVGCSESSYDRYLKELVDVGAVSTERQWAPSGDPMPNLVTVHYLQPNEDRTVHDCPEVYSNLGRGLRKDDEQTIINDPESSNQSVTASPKPKSIKQERTIVSEEWVESIRSEWEPKLVGYWRSFDQIIEWATGREYYDSTKDKRKYVLGRLEAAVKDHRATPRKAPQGGSQTSSAPVSHNGGQSVPKQNPYYAEQQRIKMEKFRENAAKGLV